MPRSGSRILDRGARLRLLAIAGLGQHHVQLVSARRAKCHTYQSTLLPPGPSRVVVDTALQLGCSSRSVIIPHLVLPYPCACFFSPALTYQQTRPDPYNSPYTTSSSGYTRLPYFASTGHRLALPHLSSLRKSSRPARLGLRLQTTRPFQIPRERPTSSIRDPATTTITTISGYIAGSTSLHKSVQRRIG
jgi:hypothetical protein